jgi:hypothetical protein
MRRGNGTGGRKAAASRVPVGADLRLPVQGQEIQPMPERRERIAEPRRRVVAIERGREGGHRRRRDRVVGDLPASLPGRELVAVER